MKHPHADILIKMANDSSKQAQGKVVITGEWVDVDIEQVASDSADRYEFRLKPRKFQKGHWYPCVDGDGDFSVKCFNGHTFSVFVGFDRDLESHEMRWIGESLGEINFGGEE